MKYLSALNDLDHEVEIDDLADVALKAKVVTHSELQRKKNILTPKIITRSTFLYINIEYKHYTFTTEWKKVTWYSDHHSVGLTKQPRPGTKIQHTKKKE